LWAKNDSLDKYEIPKVGRGYGTVPEICRNSMLGWTRVGEFTVKTALRIEDSFFNYEQAVLPHSASQENINSYHSHHLGENPILFLSSYKLVRNNQLIGLIPPPDNKLSSARGNAKSFVEMTMVQCDVSYNPVSTQNCHQDHAMNIQENKNQYDGESVDKRFTRLVFAIKRAKFNEIWKNFEDCALAAQPPSSPAAEAEPAPEPEPVPAPAPAPAAEPVRAPEPARAAVSIPASPSPYEAQDDSSDPESSESDESESSFSEFAVKHIVEEKNWFVDVY
jgi:hypothetical protein